MTARTCPEWPALMEVAPDLQFKHYTAVEAQLPGEALIRLGDVSPADAEICCDLDHNVFYAAHTDSAVTEALRATHWFELSEWSTTGPGAANRTGS